MFTVSSENNVYCILNNWCICINISCGISHSSHINGWLHVILTFTCAHRSKVLARFEIWMLKNDVWLYWWENPWALDMLRVWPLIKLPPLWSTSVTPRSEAPAISRSSGAASTYLSISLSVCLSIYLSLSLYTYMYICVYTYIYMYIHIHISAYIYLSTYLSMYISLSLYTYIYIYIYIYRRPARRPRPAAPRGRPPAPRAYKRLCICIYIYIYIFFFRSLSLSISWIC